MFKEKEEQWLQKWENQDAHFLNDQYYSAASIFPCSCSINKNCPTWECGDAGKQCIFLINLVESRNLSTKPHPFDFIKCTVKVKLHFSIGSRQPHWVEWGQGGLIQGGAA